MAKIIINKAQILNIDEDIFNLIKNEKWYTSGKSDFVQRTIYPNGRNGKRINLFLHKIIVEKTIGPIPKGMQVGILDGNKLNLKRDNLIIGTHRDLCRKNHKNKGIGKSKYIGVDFKNGKYRARIKLKYKTKEIGLFDDEIKAAKAYNKFAKKHHGQFASLNQF